MAGTREDNEILERAMRMLEEDERAREKAKDPEQLAKIAEELGIPKEYVERAVKEIESERERSRRTRRVAIAALAAVCLGGTAIALMSARQKAAREEAAEREARAEAARTLSLHVHCRHDGKLSACPQGRASAMREVAAANGLKIVVAELDPVAARRLLEGDTKALNAKPSPAARMAVVEYDAAFLEKIDPFAYAVCSGHAVIYDLAHGTLSTEKVTSKQKGGHLDQARAEEKACDAAQAEMIDWAKAALRP